MFRGIYFSLPLSQALSLLRRILPAIGPKNLAHMLDVHILPPIGYSAIAEAVNSAAATLNNLGILDSFLAVVAKALSVQVKAKGRGANILHSLTGDSTISAATLACLVNPKPVPGETTIKNQRWYLKGSINQEVGSEVVKLLKDMIKGVMGAQWQGMSKAAIGQAVLHLTKVVEEARVPNPGMFSQTVSLYMFLYVMNHNSLYAYGHTWKYMTVLSAYVWKYENHPL